MKRGRGLNAGVRVCVGFIMIFGLELFAPIATVRAASLVVNTASDEDNGSDDVCSLREAIIAANTDASYHECAATGFGDDVITFQTHTSIILTDPLPSIENAGSLTIDGSGRAVSVSGFETYQILRVNTGASLTLRKITLMDGDAEDGGAVYVAGTLIADDVIFSYNQATGSGGAVYLHIAASAHIHSCNFDHNQATWGGAFKDDNGSYLIEDSMFTYNSADYGGAIDTLTAGTVSGSTFKSNSATHRGAGIYIRSRDAMGIINSTFANNLGSDFLGAAVTAEELSVVEIVNTTFSGNYMAVYSRGTATLWNTIIANGTLPTYNCQWDDPAHKIIDGGNNLEDLNTCGFDLAKGSQTGTNPLLGALNNYGGDTHTFPLQTGSPAIDGVTWNAPNSCPFYDQRGVARAVGSCDIGSYEADPGYLVFLPMIIKN